MTLVRRAAGVLGGGGRCMLQGTRGDARENVDLAYEIAIVRAV